MAVTALIVEEIESFGDLLALEPEWRELETQAGLTLPFFTFDWVVSWWAHFREDKRAVRDSLFVRAVRRTDRTLVAVAPLMLTERPAVGPVRVRILQFFGADPNITELRGLLAAPGMEASVQRALLDNLASGSERWDWVYWGGVRAGSESEAALNLLPVQWERDIPNFVLPLPKTWDELRGGLKHNIKESLRKCYNSLKRDNHVPILEVLRARGEMAAGLAHFFRLHGARAEVGGTVQHKDVFESQVAREFLVDLCERYADRGVARIFLLKIGEQVVATRIGFAFGSTLYLYYSGYDPAWAKYSVMTTTVAEAIKYAIAEGFAEVNLSTGNDVSKTRWGPQEVVYREAVLRSVRPRGKVALEAYRYLLKAKAHPKMKQLTGRFLGRRSR